MDRKLGLSIAASVTSLMFSPPLLAHHGSRVSYDMTKELAMKGTVTDYQYQNPHIYIMYDVNDEKGDVVHWGVETYSPIVMVQQQWDKRSLKIGDEITVTVRPSKA